MGQKQLLTLNKSGSYYRAKATAKIDQLLELARRDVFATGILSMAKLSMGYDFFFFGLLFMPSLGCYSPYVLLVYYCKINVIFFFSTHIGQIFVWKSIQWNSIVLVFGCDDE